MRNKIVGYLIVGISILLGFVIWMFNRALAEIVSTSCSHGSSCPMWGTIDFQTNIGLGVMVFIILIGIYLIFFGKEQKIVTKFVKEQIKDKQISKDNYKDIMNKLNNEEKSVFEKIIESEGSMFQSELVEKTDLTKVKVTRILDKLEGKHLIERRRRGMTNIVILKK
ncbi:MAG: MarR family transcriptional regulator [Nanoarchaeota archaeon]|nr:MarR family transcriptional regulator [Nanoarchaeota archaeon]MBU4242234.1 MarR family transcriptional regulator [Nanoarchaeota archaeon]MBU4352618.1 MarR family transcriptional regulator [Nanoarchaeota archaeon]